MKPQLKSSRNLSGGREVFGARPLAAFAAGVLMLLLLATPSAADLVDVLNPISPPGSAPLLTHDSGPEALLTIKARGFIGELYNVRSYDGTILSMYHLINPLADPRTLNKFPVLINHGVIGDAAQMMSHSEAAHPRRPVIGQITADPSDTALPFFLSNNNFDVWLVDSRGTNMANRKTSWDFGLGEGAKFWNFSLDEQILFDLPAEIDFVLAMTHEPKLHYIGFSQSTLMMFALLSARPEFADKIASYVAMAPVSYLDNISGFALAIFGPSSVLPDTINGNFVPQILTDTYYTTLRSLCQNQVVTNTLCTTVLSALSGVGPDDMSHGFLAATFKSTSIKAAKHYIQMYAHKRFAMYDHGVEKNMQLYGQPISPEYDLRRIRLPYIILFRGDRDLLSDPQGQARLLRTMGVKPYLDFHYSNYDHLDFLISNTVVQDVNVPAGKAMLKLLKLQTFNMPYGFLRDPRKLLLPRPLRPVGMSFPDGNRRLEMRNDLVHNMINAVVETVDDQAAGRGLLPLPLPLVPPVATKLLRQAGNQVDQISSELTKVGDLLSIGSVATTPN